MKNSWKRATVLLVFMLAWCMAAAHAQDKATDREALAARRAEAAELIGRMLKDKSVRVVEESVIKAEAERTARSLSSEQLESLLDRGDLAVLAKQAVRANTVADAADGQIQVATEAAIGDPKSELLFVPVEPCRVLDTRFMAGGAIAANTQRHFEVAGTTGFDSQGGKAGGCDIPLGASSPIAAAVVINFIAVSPQGPGNLRAWEFGQPEPLASIINYATVPGLNIANGVIVPIAGISTVDKDLTIQADAKGTHVVADVTGYFTRFPVEQFQGGVKSTVITTQITTLIGLSDGTCKEFNSCTVTADLDGTVIVEAWGQFVVNHVAGTTDRVALGIETANPVTCNSDNSVDSSDHEVSASLGSNPDVDFTISHGRAFNIDAGQTRTYRLSGQVINGASSGDAIENSRMICTFIPD